MFYSRKEKKRKNGEKERLRVSIGYRVLASCNRLFRRFMEVQGVLLGRAEVRKEGGEIVISVMEGKKHAPKSQIKGGAARF